VTEAEWLSSDDPSRMLTKVIRNGVPRRASEPGGSTDWASDRKLRLFACAVARQLWDRLTDDLPCPTCDGSGEDQRESTFGDCPDCSGTGRINRSRRAVEVAERYADGMATEEELRHAYSNAIRATGAESATPWVRGVPCNVSEPSREFHTVQLFQRATRSGISTALQATLLREIVGNPFRPVALPKVAMTCGVGLGRTRVCGGPFVPLKKDWGLLSICKRCNADGPFWSQVVAGGPCPWLTRADCRVPKIANAIYADRAWELMPILADALEEAGCDNDELLRHCRGRQTCRACNGAGALDADHRPGTIKCRACDPWGCGTIPLRGPHVRGCWVIDLLTGRE